MSQKPLTEPAPVPPGRPLESPVPARPLTEPAPTPPSPPLTEPLINPGKPL